MVFNPECANHFTVTFCPQAVVQLRAEACMRIRESGEYDHIVVHLAKDMHTMPPVQGQAAPNTDTRSVLPDPLNAVYMKVVTPFEKLPNGHISLADYNKLIAAHQEQSLGETLTNLNIADQFSDVQQRSRWTDHPYPHMTCKWNDFAAVLITEYEMLRYLLKTNPHFKHRTRYDSWGAISQVDPMFNASIQSR